MSEARDARLGRVVCLFPGAEAGGWGGVQVSGAAAWDAVLAASVREGTSARALWYSPGGLPEDVRLPGAARVARSRWALGVEALRMRAPADTVLCWHLSLLPLVPLVAAGRPRVTLYLHGVEAWKAGREVPGWLRPDLVLTNTQETWRRAVALREGLGGLRHRTVPLGIGEPLRVPTPPPLSSPVALMLGRLVRADSYKGHLEVINAWPAVLQRLPEAELWIAGDGDLRPELEAAAAAGPAAHRIRFWGRVDEGTKARLLERAWCLALPSRNEGFGLVYLEAMRVGRPCLVGPADGGREVVQPPRAGLAADPADAERLTEALLELLQGGPDWERRSAAARLRYEARFTVAAFHRRLIAALRLPPARRAAVGASAAQTAE